MVVSSRSSSVASLRDHVEATWQLVNVDKASRTGTGQATTMGHPPTKRRRRDETEGPKRLSMFRSWSRTNTISDFTTGHRLSPSLSIESSNIDCESETKRPQSGWSDSDRSDSPAKSWVARGSKMLKKQNSKFALKTPEAMEEQSQAPDEQLYRTHNKHGRMWSTGNCLPNRPQISKPYNFQHLAHTQARHFSGIHSASQDELATDYFALGASQPPQRGLRGIRAEDLKTHNATDSSRSVYQDPITPPLFSPVKSRASRPSSVLSIKNPGTIVRSRSIDNFSLPSPKTYRVPRSPTLPPPRTSSRNATHAAPNFFSDYHHATAEERELLSICEASTERPVNEPSSPLSSTTAFPGNRLFDDARLPHAITTPDDLAFTLHPPMLRRSTLALPDVPEEDELHSTKRASMESTRPVTADSTLRHTKSFPSNSRTKHSRNGSSSRKSNRRPDSVSIEGPLAHGMVGFADIDETVDVPTRCRLSRMSMGTKGIDACWEDDIDYCYQLEAEADCDFDWDRISTNDLRVGAGTQNKQVPAETCRASADSLSRSYEMLNSHNPTQDTIDEHATSGSNNHRLPRLQTSLPDLEFSAASSAKSSMASLHGAITPLQQLPSPGKGKFALQSWKSTDTLNLDSSFFIAHDCGMPWSHEDSFQKESGRDRTSTATQRSHVVPHSPAKRSSARSSRPLLNRQPSSESLVLSIPTSSVRTRANTASGGSLPEIACSKKYRQHVEINTEQIVDRLAALSVTRSRDEPRENALTSSSSSSQIQNPTHHLSSSVSNTQGSNQGSVIALPTTEDKSIQLTLSETPQNDLLSLRWPSPPRNVLLVQKQNAPAATEALKEFARINVLLEPDTAFDCHESIPFPVHTNMNVQSAAASQAAFAQKVDLTATFGGDGTILRASSLFSMAPSVPPILSFSMGTLGFLGEWKFAEFKRAFREVYMSGAGAGDRSKIFERHPSQDGLAAQFESASSDAPTAGAGPTGWSSIRGKNLGATRGARILLRNRLKVTIRTSGTESTPSASSANSSSAIHAMNEIIIHRGATPHLAHIAIFIGGRFLTEAVADGMIVSTPTGSTAYSLSSGGSIIHPLVDSLCLTPICPRSLSFRPLVLPASTPVTLRLSEENNRGREVEVSIDGVRQMEGLRVGAEIRVVGEEILRGVEGWRGGVPCIMREGGAKGDDDGWVGGLNGLLKFNYPFGEEG
ncbi:MAG: hypothetical protein Q9172_001934 [Xanthocarpia lactea]